MWPTLWTVLAMILSLWLLGIAMKVLPVGTAYSVWVGVGAVGTVILGIVLLGEPGERGAAGQRGAHHRGDCRSRVGHTGLTTPSHDRLEAVRGGVDYGQVRCTRNGGFGSCMSRGNISLQER